jgi:S-layer protein
LDSIDGSTGTDTVNIVGAAGLSAVPSVTFAGIETVNISSGAAIGVVAGTTAVPQVDKATFAAVTQDVQQVTVLTVDNNGSTNGTASYTIDGTAGVFATNATTVATTVSAAVAAINSTAGDTVAFAGTGAVNVDTAITSTGGTTLTFTDTDVANVKVGMLATASGDIAAGAVVTGLSTTSNVTTVTLDKALVGTIATNVAIDFGGGAGGISVYGDTDGSSPSFAVTATTGTPNATTSLVTAGVEGTEGTVVNFTYGGQSGQYTIGADNDTTATAFAAAVNAVASNATAAVVNNGVTDYVTITADTAGTAVDQLVFTGAGANAPTVTTTTANVAGGVAAASYDMSGITTNTVNVTSATSANMKVITTADVNISGVTGAIAIDGGKNVSVTDTTANNAITLENMVGTATVSDTKQGTADITIDDATAVSITAGGVSTGAVSVGASVDVTGAVSIDSTGAAYATTTANTTLGAIRVDGASTVAVTQSATSSTAKAAADTANTTITQSAVTVNAEDATTSITIAQDEAVAAVDAVVAVAEKTASHKLTFTDAASGDAITLTFDSGDTIIFTASKALTAVEVAGAFANIAKNVTEGSAAASDGVYTTGGTLDGDWYSGAVTDNGDNTASVTFESLATAGETITSLANAGTGTATLAAVSAGVAKVAAVTGKMGVVNGAIDINGTTSGTDALTTVTLDNYASAAIDSDVLTTLNATGSAGAAIVTSASTGAMTVNADALATGSQISLDGSAATVTGVTLNVGSDDFVGDLVASAATSLTINATGDFTSEGATDIDAVTALTVTGAGAVNLATVGTGLAGTATSVNAATNSGGLTITYGSDTGTMTGGSGNDVITTDAEAVTKAVDLGDGDDTFVFGASHSAGVSFTKSFDGGLGEDTITLNTGNAAAADGNTVFSSAITGFEVLSLGVLASSANINTKNLGLNESIITTGVLSTNSATISGLAANASVAIASSTGSGVLTLALDVATGATDVINLTTNSDGALTVADEITVVNVETVNLNAVDKFVDVTGATDAFGANIADGKDDTNSAQSFILDIDEATTLNVTGSADVTVDLIDTNTSGNDVKTTLVDASSLTGKFTFIADGLKAGMTVKGGSGDDTLTSDGTSDTLIGGGGADKIVATTLTTATGGDGADTFVFETVTAVTAFSTITDLSATDTIDTTATAFTTTAVSIASTSTFAQFVDAAIVAIADPGSSGADAAAWFQYGGNTFLVVEGDTSGGNTFSASEDVIVGIDGLVDLSTATFNATNGEFVM